MNRALRGVGAMMLMTGFSTWLYVGGAIWSAGRGTDETAAIAAWHVWTRGWGTGNSPMSEVFIYGSVAVVLGTGLLAMLGRRSSLINRST